MALHAPLFPLWVNWLSQPSPERVAAWSAVVAKPQSEPGKATTATKPPVPPAPKPSTTSAEKPPRPEPAAPLAAAAAQSAAPAAAERSAPSAPTAPQAPLEAPTKTDATLPAPDPVGPPAAGHEPQTSAPASSPQAASATTGGPAQLIVPPAVDPAAPVAPPVAQQAQLASQSRPPSPDRRLSRPHSPAPQQDRASSRRRRNSPRRNQQSGQWQAHRGGRGGWWGPRGRNGGGSYDPPVRMADLQRAVTTAMREERAAQTQGSSHVAAAYPAQRQAALPEVPLPAAPVQSRVPAPSPPAVAASAPVPGSRLHLPPVPPVAGVEFVAVGGGAATAGGPAPLAVEEPFQFLAQALQPPQARVPEATLGQLFRLAESFHALLLIQVLAHSSLPAAPPELFLDRHRDSCLDAADQLAGLLAPVLAAPAEGGVAAAGPLDEAVRGLRRHLRAGSGAAAIGASTLVVRELWRSLTGVLHALGAHRM
ncbi:unnamed protein product [Closterium sp. Naga37s-1]|nr:unnamed protein product [Closterium sp. Naga37s-1]